MVLFTNNDKGIRMMEDRWRAWGLEPFPRLAPPYSHVLGRGRLVLSAYDEDVSDSERLSEHWHVDTSVATGPEPLRRGDLVVWVGRAEGDDTVLVWPPALVVEASERRVGAQRVATLTFTEHEPQPLEDVPGDLRVLLARGGVADAGQRARLLDEWGLDVLCPQCGDVGLPIAWGLPLPEDYEDQAPPRTPYERGSARVLGGCVVTDALHHCGRCGHEWPSWEQWPA